jgi:PAS domain S-box-containing protein
VSILTILYILSSFLLIYGAATIYNGNRQSPKHRAFGLLFVFMACWHQSAMLIIMVPLEQATYVFVYGLIPLLLGSFILLLHAVYLLAGVYTRKYAVMYKLLFLPPIINVFLFPVDGWLYEGKLRVYDIQPPPGPGSFINFGTMFVYLVVMIVLLFPQAWRKHRPSQIWMMGMGSFVLWVLLIIIFGESRESWDSFSLVPFGIIFWAVAVYISVEKYDSLPSYERRYNVLFEKAPIGILITDSRAIIREVSPRAAKHLDMSANQLLGQSIFMRLDEQEREQQIRHYRDQFDQRKPMQRYGFSFQDGNGRLKFLSVSSDYIEMEGNAYQLLMVENITDSKLRENQIHELAYFDQLSGLHNRVSFNLSFEDWRNNKREFALVLFDLDGFKQINDQYGHLVGDQALKHFATILKASADSADFVARLSGDEFVMLLSDVEAIDSVLQTIRIGLEKP